MAFLFKELLQISIGKRDGFSVDVDAKDLASLYADAKKQALVGMLYVGIERIYRSKKCSEAEKKIIFQWLTTYKALELQNKTQNEQIEKLSLCLRQQNIKNTLLKGQGYAMLYPEPMKRQCGDIDLWVDASREEISAICESNWGIDHVDYKNLVLANFPKAHVEVHFIPSWFYSPIVNWRFKKWYKEILGEQFQLQPTNRFPTPTLDFNLVYCCVHIYRHIFDEGIGLRQLTDYYYLLLQSSLEQRELAYKALCGFKMKKFVGAIMYVLKYFFEIDDSLLLCAVNERTGMKLLSDILRGGNFGQHNPKNSDRKRNRILRGIRNLRQNSAVLFDYPSEVLWSPFWKIWHWCWRKAKGYL